MAARFADTKRAFEKGLAEVKPEKGSDLVEDWEAALSDTDVSGAKGIQKNLESLRKQLDKSNPDPERIKTLLARLGEATTKIADKADRNGAKVKELGEALTKAGEGADGGEN